MHDYAVAFRVRSVHCSMVLIQRSARAGRGKETRSRHNVSMINVDDSRSFNIDHSDIVIGRSMAASRWRAL